MFRFSSAWFCVILLLAVIVPVTAQDRSTNAAVEITAPLPVFLVSDTIAIRGTADPDNLSNYRLDYALMTDYVDGTIVDDSLDWQLLSGPVITGVNAGVLGVWDTTQVEDGIYALRLTVQLSSGDILDDTISPIRVMNQSDPAVLIAVNEAAGLTTANIQVIVDSANVRTGDSRNYPIITFLQQGAVAPILAISSTGSGWFLISLPDGREGWISPTTVNTDADLALLPRQTPPPAPAQSANPAPITAPGAVETAPPATGGTQPLTVRTICDPNRAYSGKFMINNPNPFEVPVNYRLSTGTSGFVFARPGGDTNVDVALFEGQLDFSFTIDWGGGTVVAASRCGQ